MSEVSRYLANATNSGLILLADQFATVQYIDIQYDSQRMRYLERSFVARDCGFIVSGTTQMS